MTTLTNGDGPAFRTRLLQKLEEDTYVKFTAEEKMYIYNLMMNENRSADKASHCSSENEKSNEQSASKRKKPDFEDTNKTSCRNTRTRRSISSYTNSTLHKSDRPMDEVLKNYKDMDFNYEQIQHYLRNTYNLPLEERDQETFDRCFKILFEKRRVLITSQFPTVRTFKEFHPYLFQREHVFTEFALIVQRENLYAEYVENVKKHSSSVLECAAPSPSKKMILNTLENADDKEWIQMAGSLIMLPKYMNDDRRGLLICDNEKHIQVSQLPYIRCFGDTGSCLKKKCEFEVVIESMKLCEVTNIMDAFFGLMAAYYIFDAKYSPAVHSTLELFERLYIAFSEKPCKLSQNVEEKISYLKKVSLRKQRERA